MGNFAFVVDDDSAVCGSLASFLDASGIAVRTFPSAVDFLANCDTNTSGCVVADVRMPEMSGFDLLESLQQRKSPLSCILITGHGDIPMAVKAMQIGAVDFLEKPFFPGCLLEAVKRGIEASEVEANKRQGDTEREVLLDSLTSDERTVLEWITAGLSNARIAQQMGLSLRTVQFRRSSLMRKLNVKTRSELLAVMVPKLKALHPSAIAPIVKN